MTKLEAVRELKTYDHLFLSPEGVKRFTEPFGFIGSTYTAKDTRSQFKGLNLGEGYKEGDNAEGQDADVVAVQIAEHLDVCYIEMFGRGSRLRECCRAIERYLIEKGEI